MLNSVYCIRDNRVGFLSPMVDQNDATAMRNFEHALSNLQTVLGTHPEDFDLYKIAVFDTESGRIEPLEVPEFIQAGHVAAGMNKKKGKNRNV